MSEISKSFSKLISARGDFRVIVNHFLRESLNYTFHLRQLRTDWRLATHRHPAGHCLLSARRLPRRVSLLPSFVLSSSLPLLSLQFLWDLRCDFHDHLPICIVRDFSDDSCFVFGIVFKHNEFNQHDMNLIKYFLLVTRIAFWWVLLFGCMCSHKLIFPDKCFN